MLSPQAEEPPTSSREPMFNLPGSISVLLIAFVGVHLLRLYVLSPQLEIQFVFSAAFIPLRFAYPVDGIWDAISLYLTPLTYSFLHGDWVHLGFNSFWLLAFGTPLARRFGVSRFFALCAITSMSGALAHFWVYPESDAPVIGASAIVSGMMGAASRFVFNGAQFLGGPGGFRSGVTKVEHFPASSLVQSFSNSKFLIFFGVWFGINFIFGAGFINIAGQDNLVAWQAHIGGFVGGILFFSLLDPISQRFQ